MEKRLLWLPISKTVSGEYRGILSDDSTDRDDEFISVELLNKWAKDPNRYIPALADHRNEIDSLIGKWINPIVIKSAKNYGLSVKPEFFDANPKAKMVKGMLDQGAQIGLSIGAIPGKSTVIEKDGKKIRRWDDAELVEGSFTPIPSNRNSYVVLAKNFGLDKITTTTSDEYSEEIYEEDEEIEKKVAKRGNKWCVIHCTGPDKGKPIKCFDTKEEAEKMHRAIQAKKSLEKAKPPKEWMERCMTAVKGKAKEPGALCNWIWNNMKKDFDLADIKLAIQKYNTHKEDIKMTEEKIEETPEPEPKPEEDIVDKRLSAMEAKIDKIANLLTEEPAEKPEPETPEPEPDSEPESTLEEKKLKREIELKAQRTPEAAEIAPRVDNYDLNDMLSASLFGKSYDELN